MAAHADGTDAAVAAQDDGSEAAVAASPTDLAEMRFKRDSQRRRAHGGGRPRSCEVLREELMVWYSIVRHSVDVKIMCRFPKKVLMVKAHMLQQDYYAACLTEKVEAEHVQVDGPWLNALLAEYRLSSRKPNRKFKVPRWVLGEKAEVVLDRIGETKEVGHPHLRL